MSLRPTQLKLFLLEQHIKKEQDQQLKQAQETEDKENDDEN